jgi:hypothetical protein
VVNGNCGWREGGIGDPAYKNTGRANLERESGGYWNFGWREGGITDPAYKNHRRGRAMSGSRVVIGILVGGRLGGAVAAKKNLKNTNIYKYIIQIRLKST